MRDDTDAILTPTEYTEPAGATGTDWRLMLFAALGTASARAALAGADRSVTRRLDALAAVVRRLPVGSVTSDTHQRLDGLLRVADADLPGAVGQLEAALLEELAAGRLQ